MSMFLAAMRLELEDPKSQIHTDTSMFMQSIKKEIIEKLEDQKKKEEGYHSRRS